MCCGDRNAGGRWNAGRRARGSGLLLCWTAGLLDCWTHSGRVLMRRPRVSSRAGCAVLRCLATMVGWMHCTARWMAAMWCGAVRKGRGETRRETARRDETDTRDTRDDGGRQASMALLPSRCTRPQALPQAFEKTFRITLPAVPAPLIEC